MDIKENSTFKTTILFGGVLYGAYIGSKIPSTYRRSFSERLFTSTLGGIVGALTSVMMVEIHPLSTISLIFALPITAIKHLRSE